LEPGVGKIDVETANRLIVKQCRQIYIDMSMHCAQARKPADAGPTVDIIDERAPQLNPDIIDVRAFCGQLKQELRIGTAKLNLDRPWRQRERRRRNSQEPCTVRIYMMTDAKRHSDSYPVLKNSQHYDTPSS